jgi:hypothetical protein
MCDPGRSALARVNGCQKISDCVDCFAEMDARTGNASNGDTCPGHRAHAVGRLPGEGGMRESRTVRGGIDASNCYRRQNRRTNHQTCTHHGA